MQRDHIRDAIVQRTVSRITERYAKRMDLDEVIALLEEAIVDLKALQSVRAGFSPTVIN